MTLDPLEHDGGVVRFRLLNLVVVLEEQIVDRRVVVLQLDDIRSQFANLFLVDLTHQLSEVVLL